MENMRDRPNILYIDAHDLGDWLGCYGRAGVASPHIDELAAEGLRFSQYIAAAPICMPSRAAMYSGLMPHAAGVVGQDPLDEDVICLPEYLRRAGYATVLSKGLNIYNAPASIGFQRVLDRDGAAREDLAADFLRHEAPDLDRPFFLMASFGEVHRPYGTEWDPAVEAVVDVPPSLPDIPDVKKDLAALCHQIAILDAKVGKILTALRDSGLDGNTIVIFTTEHGIAAPRHKNTLFEGGILTALVLRDPRICRPGAVHDELLSNVSLTPTILGLAGVEADQDLLGRSFAPLYRGEAWGKEKAVFSEHTWGRRGQWFYTPLRSIRTERFHYIHTFSRMPPYVDNGWLSRVRKHRDLVKARYSDPLPEENLYDIQTDPDELCNQAANDEFDAIKTDLKNRLFDFLEKTGDPILRGPVPNKTGAPDRPQWIETRDGSFKLSPDEPPILSEDPFS